MGTVAYQTLLDANMPTAGVERQDSFKSVLRDVKRKLSTIERKTSKQENIKSSNSQFSSLKSTPFTSAHASPNRSPFNTERKIIENPEEEEPEHKEVKNIDTPPRSPLPLGSPLLNSRVMSSALQRARSFNKELRRQASFRAAREKHSLSRNASPACSRNASPICSRAASPVCSRNTSPVRCESPVIPQEISFRIKKCLGSRKGWKIFPEDDDIVGEMDTKALKTVVNMIKELECQGFAVPERISVKV